MRPRVIDKLLSLQLPTTAYGTYLDIGTGDGNVACSHPYYAKIPNKTGIDPQRPLKLFHHPSWTLLKEAYKEGCSVWENEYDLITLYDIIEHYTKEEGTKILDHIEQKGKLIVIFTPSGFYPQDGNEWDSHKCGWTAQEFLDRGYSVHLLKDFHEKGDALFAWK